MEGENLARDDSNKLDLQRAIGRDDMEVQPSVLLSLKDCSMLSLKGHSNQRRFLLTGKSVKAIFKKGSEETVVN